MGGYYDPTRTPKPLVREKKKNGKNLKERILFVGPWAQPTPGVNRFGPIQITGAKTPCKKSDSWKDGTSRVPGSKKKKKRKRAVQRLWRRT